MLVGVGFMLLGLALGGGCVAGAVLLPAESVGLPVRAVLVVLATLPLLTAALGFLLTFGGQRITIDGASEQVRITYGRWWPWERETRPLGDFNSVGICREVAAAPHHGGSGGTASHPIRLQGDGDEVELAGFSKYDQARRKAEQIAGFVGLALCDSTLGETVVREAGTLDESLRERAIRLGEAVEWPRPPRSNRIELRHSGDETIMDLPRISLRQRKGDLIGTVVLLIIWSAMAVPGLLLFRSFLGETHSNLWLHFAQAGLVSLPVLPVVYVALGVLVLLTVRERIVVSPRLLRREWRFPVGCWTRRVPAGEIEELLIDGDDVVVRTDRTRCRFGVSLTAGERRWLRDAVRYVLVGKPIQPGHRPDSSSVRAPA